MTQIRMERSVGARAGSVGSGARTSGMNDSAYRMARIQELRDQLPEGCARIVGQLGQRFSGRQIDLLASRSLSEDELDKVVKSLKAYGATRELVHAAADYLVEVRKLR